jgi:fatty acid desaturase
MWHHSFPNNIAADTDTRIGAPYFRFNSSVPRHPAQRFLQPLVLFLLTGLTAIRWIWSDLFDSFHGFVGGNKFPSILLKRARLASVFRLVWIALSSVAIPLLMVSWREAALLWFATMLITGYQLSLTFIVNHIQSPFSLKPKELHWSEEQVFETTNWSEGSHLWNWLSGGLNHQVSDNTMYTRVSYFSLKSLITLLIVF